MVQLLGCRSNKKGILLCRQGKYKEALEEFKIALRTESCSPEQELCIRKNIVETYRGLDASPQMLWKVQKDVYVLENKLHGSAIPPAFTRETVEKKVGESKPAIKLEPRQEVKYPAQEAVVFYQKIIRSPSKGDEKFRSVALMGQFLEMLDKFVHLKQQIPSLKGEEQLRAKAKCVAEAESIISCVQSMKQLVKFHEKSGEFETAMYLIEGIYRGIFAIDPQSPELTSLREEHQRLKDEFKADLVEKAGKYK